jgi:hypothetical protein
MGKRSVRPFAVSHSTVYIIFPPRIFIIYRELKFSNRISCIVVTRHTVSVHVWCFCGYVTSSSFAYGLCLHKKKKRKDGDFIHSASVIWSPSPVVSVRRLKYNPQHERLSFRED